MKSTRTRVKDFLVEAVALNGVLIASIARNNSVERRLLATLQASAAR